MSAGKSKIIIVVPIYKNPTPDELVSLERCCEILGNYEHAIVCPKSFDLSVYYKIWGYFNLQFKEERFEDYYFSSILGYNKLTLSKYFYERFSPYEYMLIYQPDAYVFRDDLDLWVSKGYDYVGAPFVENPLNLSDKSYDMLLVGNGGFSLRRISFFINFFHSYKNVYSLRYVASSLNIIHKPSRCLLLFLMMLGWRNKPASAAYNWWRKGLAEDIFWTLELNNSNFKPYCPSGQEALSFGFEKFPSKYFDILGKLPMGCHAWPRNEYHTFWIHHIDTVPKSVSEMR